MEAWSISDSLTTPTFSAIHVLHVVHLNVYSKDACRPVGKGPTKVSCSKTRHFSRMRLLHVLSTLFRQRILYHLLQTIR